MSLGNYFDSKPDVAAVTKAEEIEQKYNLRNYDNSAKLSDIISDAEEFFHLISFLNAQAKSSDIESFIAGVLGGTKIPASDDRGDIVVDGKYYELKTSTTNKGKNLNIRQIRPWQDVDFYVCSYIEERDLPKSAFFLLTKEQMAVEVELIGGFTHGTKRANESNINNEYSITIPVIRTDNEHMSRWIRDYHFADLHSKIAGK